jgi:hypothetical protein
MRVGNFVKESWMRLKFKIVMILDGLQSQNFACIENFFLYFVPFVLLKEDEYKNLFGSQ